MADVDINPFGDHELTRPEEPTSENIALSPIGGGSTWRPEHVQETSLGGESQRTRVLKDYVKDLYQWLSEKLVRTSEVFHFDDFELRDGELYHKDISKPLTYRKGNLRMVKEIKKILGERRLRDLGFDVPKGKVTAWQVVMLNRVEEELPSSSDVDNSDDIDHQEIMENALKSMEDLITQFEGEETLSTHELLGLDKQLRSIMGLLKVEVAKRVQLEESIKKEKCKLEEIRDYPGVYDDGIREDIIKRIAKLNDELKVRQESIDLLKGRLMNQITSFKETIAKALDKDISLANKIRTLFREQGITIASILTAIGMAIGVLIEALLSGGGTATSLPPPKDEKGVKEWLRNKLKALALLLGRLGMKAAEVLPGITGTIISWVLNRAAEVVGWVSQNLWALIVSVGGLLYTYMVMKK